MGELFKLNVPFAWIARRAPVWPQRCYVSSENVYLSSWLVLDDATPNPSAQDAAQRGGGEYLSVKEALEEVGRLTDGVKQ